MLHKTALVKGLLADFGRSVFAHTPFLPDLIQLCAVCDPEESSEWKAVWNACWGGNVCEVISCHYDTDTYYQALQKLIWLYDQCLNQLGNYGEKYRLLRIDTVFVIFVPFFVFSQKGCKLLFWQPSYSCIFPPQGIYTYLKFWDKFSSIIFLKLILILSQIRNIFNLFLEQTYSTGARISQSGNENHSKNLPVTGKKIQNIIAIFGTTLTRRGRQIRNWKLTHTVKIVYNEFQGPDIFCSFWL